MQINFTNNSDLETNSRNKTALDTDTELKQMLVNYVGENNKNTANQQVTVEQIVETMAIEFPEFVLAVAEENFIRGYQQAMEDIEIDK